MAMATNANRTPLFSRRVPGGVFTIVDESKGTGSIWWVCSTTGVDDGKHGYTPDLPFATLVYAESIASADDTIYVMPGHTETVGATGAAGMTLNVAGLQVKGLGGRTRKPAFLIDGFNDTYVSIAGADTLVENICFKAGHADIASGVIISAGGVELRKCNFIENVATENFVDTIVTTNAADDLLIEDCFITTIDAAASEGIKIVGACNNVVLRNNYVKGSFAVSCVSAITAACLDMLIDGNRLINTTAGDDLAGCIDLVAASTGMICNNRVYMEDNTDCLTSIDGANCARADNKCANEYGEEAGAAGAVST